MHINNADLVNSFKDKICRYKSSAGFLLFLASLHFACRATLNSRYWVNDDLALLYFSNGEWTGAPEKNLVFAHPIFGTLTSFAYDLNSSLPWYSYQLLVALILGFIALVHNMRIKRFRLFAMFVGAISVIHFTLLPTFTFAAIICSGLGLTLIFLQSSKFHLAKSLLGLCLLTLGISIRPESKFIAIAIATPMLINSWRQILKRRDTAEVFGHSLLTLITLIIIFLMQSGSFTCESSSPEKCNEWAIYTQYNYERGQFHGNPNMELLEARYAEIGWTELDMTLFSSWLYPDDPKFGPESIHQAFEIVSQSRESGIIDLSLLSPRESIKSISIKWYVLVLLAFCLGAVALSKKHILKNQLYLPGLTLFSWATVILLLSTVRLPQTVVIPTTLLCCAATIVAFDQNQNLFDNSPKRWMDKKIYADDALQVLKNNFLIILLSTFLALFARDMISVSITSSYKNESGKTALQMVTDAVVGGPILIAPEVSDKLLNHDPWVNDLTLGKTKVQLMGWPVFSPHQGARLRNSGLNGMFRPFVFGSAYFVPNYSFCGSAAQAKTISEYLFQEYEYRNIARQTLSVVGVCEIWNFTPA